MGRVYGRLGEAQLLVQGPICFSSWAERQAHYKRWAPLFQALTTYHTGPKRMLLFSFGLCVCNFAGGLAR